MITIFIYYTCPFIKFILTIHLPLFFLKVHSGNAVTQNSYCLCYFMKPGLSYIRFCGAMHPFLAMPISVRCTCKIVKFHVLNRLIILGH